MSARTFGGRRARFESLELRQLLAGDVTVSVVEGNLVVEGDELANQIAITAGEVPGTYIVRGLDGTNVVHSPTPTAETSPVDEVVVTGVTGDARIGLGAGDDRLVVSNVGFRGGVLVRMGEGNDEVAIGLRPVPEANPESVSTAEPEMSDFVRIRGALKIGTGEGDDKVHVDHAVIGGQLRVEAGRGEDVVRLGHADPPTPGDLTSATAVVRNVLRVDQGIDVELGAGRDQLFADAVLTGHGLLANGGEGEDALHTHHVRSGGPLVLLGGGGDSADTIDVARVRAGTALLATGDGNDHVRIVDSAFRVLGVALGNGDDSLRLRGNKAGWAFLLGGDGTDELHNVSGNRFGHHFDYGFESHADPSDEPDSIVA